MPSVSCIQLPRTIPFNGSRYLHQTLESRGLDLPHAQNVLSECRKIKSVSGKVAEVRSTSLSAAISLTREYT